MLTTCADRKGFLCGSVTDSCSSQGQGLRRQLNISIPACVQVRAHIPGAHPTNSEGSTLAINAPAPALCHYHMDPPCDGACQVLHAHKLCVCVCGAKIGLLSQRSLSDQ